jgi:hypothetical protein
LRWILHKRLVGPAKLWRMRDIMRSYQPWRSNVYMAMYWGAMRLSKQLAIESSLPRSVLLAADRSFESNI